MRGRAARGRPGGWTLRVILGLVSLGLAAGIAACVAEVRPTSERSDVGSSAPTSRDVENFARPGETIEVFSTEPLSADLVGTNVTAVVQLTGTTEGTRWILTEITPRP